MRGRLMSGQGEQKRGSAVLKWITDIAVIIVSGAIYALGVNCFTSPNDIAPGGATGIAIIVSSVTELPVGILIAAINIPLIIAGFILLNKVTMIKTLIAVAVITVMTDFLLADIPPYIAENGGGILAAIFGGVLMGAGLGFVYAREGTCGGSDIVAKIINRFLPDFKLGQIQFAADALVVMAGYAVYRDLNVVLYAIVAIFVQSKVVDVIVYGGQESRFLMIMSEKSREIADRLITTHRGVTLLDGEGAYSGAQRSVIVTAVHRSDYIKVRRIIREVDPSAFVVVTGANEVLGKGFQELK